MRFLPIALLSLALLAGCSQSRFVSYDGPEVTRIEVHKRSRMMYLLNDRDVLEAYEIELGFAPEHHKQIEATSALLAVKASETFNHDLNAA
ncbi:MAG: hypothetical protein AAF376_13235, partial [Pseudomonadota bacterium]